MNRVHLKPSKTNPRVKRWQRAPEVEPGRGQLSLPLLLDALERTGKAPGGATRGSYLARDAAGREHLVKPRLGKSAILGELIGPVVARAVGLQAPENVAVLKDGVPVGIASPIVPGLRGIIPYHWDHPQALLSLSVRDVLHDADSEGTDEGDLLVDKEGRLWLLDFEGAKPAGWLAGEPRPPRGTTEVGAKYLPKQIPALVEGWQRALNQPPSVFDSPSIRLLAEPPKLHRSLIQVAEAVLARFAK